MCIHIRATIRGMCTFVYHNQSDSIHTSETSLLLANMALTSRIHMCSMAHIYVYRDSFIRALLSERCVYTRARPPCCLLVWYSPDICAMTHICVLANMALNSRIHMCAMTHICVYHDSSTRTLYQSGVYTHDCDLLAACQHGTHQIYVP